MRGFPLTRAIFFMVFALLFPIASNAQMTPQHFLTMQIKPETSPVPGKPFVLLVQLNIKSGYHIQSHKPSENFYIPTVVEVKAPKGFHPGAPVYPKSVTANVAGTKVLVYEGVSTVRVPISVPAGKKGNVKFIVEVDYQACNDQSCFAPTNEKTEWILDYTKKNPPARGTISPGKKTQLPPGKTSSVIPISAAFSALPGYRLDRLERFAPPDEFVRFLQTGSTNPDQGIGALDRLLKSGQLLLALPLIFLLGLALNLTPCVYPIIPITIGYFGSQAGQSGRSPVALSLIYLLGMAMMYSALGVLAGLTGGLFGAQLQNPWVLGVFALVMFGLSLSQFDRPNGMPIWEFQLPAALRNKTGSRAGAAGAFVMGLLVGVVAAPCIGPAVIALLQWVGAQRSAFLGFIIFFTLSLGLGLPYVVLASLSGSVRKIPRSGEWMIGVKHFFGLIMIWMGFYYLQTLLDRLHPGVGWYVLTAITVIAGIFLLFDRAGSNARIFYIFRKAAGVCVIAAAIWMVQPSRSSSIQWQTYSPQALQAASAQHKNIIIDFSANWCVACKELENKTFTDKKVGDAARDFSAFKVDMTDFASPQAQQLKEQYGIAGLPTVARLTPKEDAH